MANMIGTTIEMARSEKSCVITNQSILSNYFFVLLTMATWQLVHTHSWKVLFFFFCYNKSFTKATKNYVYRLIILIILR